MQVAAIYYLYDKLKLCNYRSFVNALSVDHSIMQEFYIPIDVVLSNYL